MAAVFLYKKTDGATSCFLYFYFDQTFGPEEQQGTILGFKNMAFARVAGALQGAKGIAGILAAHPDKGDQTRFAADRILALILVGPGRRADGKIIEVIGVNLTKIADAKANPFCYGKSHLVKPDDEFRFIKIDAADFHYCLGSAIAEQIVKNKLLVMFFH